MNFIKVHHPRVVFSVLLCALTAYLYSFSLGHNFLFDEVNIILLNPLIRDFTQIPELLRSGFFQKIPGIGENWEQYYRPIALFSFMLDFQVWKTYPLGYNLTNALLQCLAVVLLFHLLLKIFGKDGRVAFFSALLFAVHPIHTESVTYIASRGDLMSAAFILGAMILYWDSKIVGALFCYTAALFCKESALLLPVYLTLLEIAFLHTPIKKTIKKLIPFLLIAALYLVFRKTICPIPMGPPTFSWERAFFRFLSMGVPFLSYLKALVLPEPFKFCESVEFASGWRDARVWTTLYVLALLIAAWGLTLKKRREAFFGLSWFLISLAPSLQIIHFFPEWAEHYLYMPSMGLTVLMACLLREIFKTQKRAVLAAFFAVYLPFTLFLGFRTAQRNGYYNNTEKYYEALAESNSPYAYYGFINLALFDVVNKSWDAAFVNLRTAYLINPVSETNNYNLGLYYMTKKQYGKAYSYFKAAYESPTGNHQPTHAMRMGQALILMGDTKEGIRIFEEVQAKMPEAALIYKHLVRAYELTGDAQKALFWVQKGKALVDPRNIDHSSLLMEEVLLAYLNGWQEALTRAVDELLRKPNTSENPNWYVESAKLFKGILSVEAYGKIVMTQYSYNENNAAYCVLISHVLQKRWQELSEFVRENRSNFEERSSDPMFTKMLFDRAEKELHENFKPA